MFVSFKYNAQPYISATSVVNAGKLFNLKREYPSELNYKVKGGFSFSLILDSINNDKNLRIGLEYGQQNLSIYERSYDKWGAGGSSNYSIHFQYFQLDLSYKFQLVTKSKYLLSLFSGPSFSLSNNVILNGFGSTTTNTMAVNSSGMWYPISTTSDWQKENETTTKFAKFNLGLNLGLSFNYPLTRKINLILENKYTLFFRNTTSLDSSNNTFYVRSGLSFGVRFRI